MPDLVSRPFNPDPAKCCEACVFGAMEHGGRYEHAEWCQSFGARTWRTMPRQLMEVAKEADLPLSDAQLDKWVEQWVEP